MHAVPFAKLRPFKPRGDKPNPYPSRPVKKPDENQFKMSVGLIVPVAIHQSGCVRSIIRARVREAIKLAAARGVASAPELGPGAVVLRKEEVDPSMWLLSGEQDELLVDF